MRSRSTIPHLRASDSITSAQLEIERRVRAEVDQLALTAMLSVNLETSVRTQDNHNSTGHAQASDAHPTRNVQQAGTPHRGDRSVQRQVRHGRRFQPAEAPRVEHRTCPPVTVPRAASPLQPERFAQQRALFEENKAAELKNIRHRNKLHEIQVCRERRSLKDPVVFETMVFDKAKRNVNTLHFDAKRISGWKAQQQEQRQTRWQELWDNRSDLPWNDWNAAKNQQQWVQGTSKR